MATYLTCQENWVHDGASIFLELSHTKRLKVLMLAASMHPLDYKVGGREKPSLFVMILASKRQRDLCARGT